MKENVTASLDNMLRSEEEVAESDIAQYISGKQGNLHRCHYGAECD